jgi:hypothetical protein
MLLVGVGWVVVGLDCQRRWRGMLRVIVRRRYKDPAVPSGRALAGCFSGSDAASRRGESGAMLSRGGQGVVEEAYLHT